MVDPTVLVMPMVRAPRFLQYLRALRVSAVSPDWEIKKQTSSLKIGVCLSKKSDAKSSMTGSSVSSSRRALQAIAEWYDVPQPMRSKRRHLLISGMNSLMPPKVITSCND
jgi:hypothetical protein